MIPAHLIDHTTAKQGLADAVETVWVKHRSGGMSVVTLKSYDQRREAFQGTAQHLIWLDEEPPEDILTESIMRTAKTSDFPGGMVMLTFTPLQGLTPLILSFLPGGRDPQPIAASFVKRVRTHPRGHSVPAAGAVSLPWLQWSPYSPNSYGHRSRCPPRPLQRHRQDRRRRHGGGVSSSAQLPVRLKVV